MDRQAFIEQALKNRLFSFQRVTASKYQDTATYYADMRAIYSYPSLFSTAVEWCADVLRAKSYDFICGVETASLPLAGALTYHMQRPSLYLRTKPKSYGLGKVVEGHYQPGDAIYLVDDLSVTAAESLEFIRIAEGAGLKVKGLIVLYEKVCFDKGRNIFLDGGYEYHSMFTYLDLAEYIEQHHHDIGLDPALAHVVKAYGDNVQGRAD